MSALGLKILFCLLHTVFVIGADYICQRERTIDKHSEIRCAKADFH